MRLSESEELLYDISRVEHLFSNNIDPELLKRIGEDKELQRLIMLLKYAPNEFISQITERLEQFKMLSKV